MPFITAPKAGHANRCAFLDAIAWSEIGPDLLDKTDDGYNVLVGSTDTNPLTFQNYATHPHVYNAKHHSTAAGRYQLLFRYWLAYKTQLNLVDFGPLSQDMIALQQIKECRALKLIDSGNIPAAVKACSHIWASLPGNAYKQHTNSIPEIQSAFVNAGGSLTI